MMIAVFIALTLWTVVSFWFFAKTMGHKARQGRWYDLPMLVPMLGIAFLVKIARERHLATNAQMVWTIIGMWALVGISLLCLRLGWT